MDPHLPAESFHMVSSKYELFDKGEYERKKWQQQNYKQPPCLTRERSTRLLFIVHLPTSYCLSDQGSRFSFRILNLTRPRCRYETRVASRTSQSPADTATAVNYKNGNIILSKNFTAALIFRLEGSQTSILKWA